MASLWLCAALVAAGLGACSAQVTDDAAGATGGTGGAGGVTTASSGHAGTGGGASSSSTGVISETATSSGAGGGACGTQTDGTFSFTLDKFDGTSFACAAAPGPGGETRFNAAIASFDASTGEVLLDSCSPAADCIPFISHLHLATVGVGTFFATGAYVEVHAKVDDNGFFCTETLSLTNLTSWDGDPNPAGPGSFIWYEGSNGGGSFADTGLTVAAVPMHCAAGGGTCQDPDTYFYRVGYQGQTVDVAMGASQVWGTPTTMFENLASYTVDVCDAPPRFAYVAHIVGLE